MRFLMSWLLVAFAGGCTATQTDTPSTGDSADTGSTSPTVTETIQVGATRLHDRVRTIVIASWTQVGDAEATWVSWKVDGEPRATPPTARVHGQAAEAVLLGVPAETRVEPVLHRVTDRKESTSALPAITTGALPTSLIVPTLTDVEDGAFRPEAYTLLSVDVGPSPFLGPWVTLILDARGRIVWYRETSGSRLTFRAAVSDGHVIIDEANTYAPGTRDTLTRTTLDLGQTQEIELPDFQIAYDEMPDGGFVFAAGGGYRDYTIERWYPNGTTETVWNCTPWMEQWTTIFWNCNANTLQYNADRNSFLYSTFETNTVAEVSADGQVVRALGQRPGSYAVSPSDAQLQHQHFPQLTASGTLLTQTDSPSKAGQWVREYEIDDLNEEFRVIFSLRSTHFADYGGHAQRLPSGHILWAHGTAGVLEELTPKGDVVWAVDFAGHVLGNATPVADLYALNEGIGLGSRLGSR